MKTSAFTIFDLRSSNFVSPPSPPGSGFKEAIEFVKDFSGSTSLFSLILEVPDGEYFHAVWWDREVVGIGSDDSSGLSSVVLGAPAMEDFHAVWQAREAEMTL